MMHRRLCYEIVKGRANERAVPGWVCRGATREPELFAPDAPAVRRTRRARKRTVWPFDRARCPGVGLLVESHCYGRKRSPCHWCQPYPDRADGCGRHWQKCTGTATPPPKKRTPCGRSESGGSALAHSGETTTSATGCRRHRALPIRDSGLCLCWSQSNGRADALERLYRRRQEYGPHRCIKPIDMPATATSKPAINSRESWHANESRFPAR